MSALEIVELDAAGVEAAIGELAAVLADCVNGGASVNFMLPYGPDDAAQFFRKVSAGIARGEIVLLAAKLGGRIVGTVQLGMDTPPNQPHRGEIRKLLVHRAARNKGVGAALMQRIEAIAKARGRTLLVLDTANDSAERLYARGGWQRLGTIPDYALWPQGGLCNTIVFWKKL
ncbi:MAG TPA: GNAT family N-acetyltransferase [Pseudolabrys sp.]|jgi:GNAT superfamily N-acetyltransferase|nr:GNAT family N-acetyltransferase [Pseudolabrys sp.]